MQPPPRKTRRLSLNTGLFIGVTGSLLGYLILPLTSYIDNSFLQLIMLAVSFGLLAYFPHCLAHYIVGESVGLKFSHYVLGSSPLTSIESPMVKRLDSLIPRLGIRLESQSRGDATYWQRVTMFSSGVIASTLLPLIPTITAFRTLPFPSNALLPIAWLAYLAFGVYSSPRFGDISRIKIKP